MKKNFTCFGWVRVYAIMLELLFILIPRLAWGQVAQFDFPASNSLVVSTKDANVSVSNMSLSSGTIETNITTGSYFPNEPYIEETGGWNATTQATAKNFTFTVTSNSGYTFSITNISFRAYATSAGPTAFGFGIGSTDIYNVDAPDISIIAIDQSVSGQTGLTTATIKIQGWLNGSRTSAGSGVFKLDDVVISGTVTSISSPTKLAITSITPTSPTVGSGFNVTVQAQDGSNNPGNVTATTAFSLTTNGNAGTIGGTTTGSITAGSSSVTLSGVTLSSTGTGVNLTATRTSGDILDAGMSSTFSVLQAATHLAFGTSPPSSGSVGVTLTSFTVEARRPDNSVDNSYTGNITVSKASGSGTLTGTTSVAAVAGVATFSTLQLSAADTYTLSGSASGLTFTTSGDIVIGIAPIAWSNNGTAAAWYTSGNWNPSTTSGAWLITDIAQFPANSGSATTVGINMNTKSLSLGAIDVTSARPRALTIGSSNLTGSLTLNGTSINGTSM